jgi:hypothetical protein
MVMVLNLNRGLELGLSLPLIAITLKARSAYSNRAVTRRDLRFPPLNRQIWVTLVSPPHTMIITQIQSSILVSIDMTARPQIFAPMLKYDGISPGSISTTQIAIATN